MQDSRHPDQRLLSKELQAWWLQFLRSQPSNEQLRQDIMTNKPWKAEAAAELLQRIRCNCLDEQCLLAIATHVAEHRSRALELLDYIHRIQKLKSRSLDLTA